MRTALAARGHRPRHLLDGATTGRLATALFLRAHARGERVHVAMAARGWAGVPPRASPRPLARADVAFVAALAVAAARRPRAGGGGMSCAIRPAG